jgi:uncharacterized protein YecT (DUF1311 family)
MRLMACLVLLITVSAEIALAQPSAPTSRSPAACKSPRSAISRLICAEPDLDAVQSILALALQEAKSAASTNDQKISMAREQLSWMRDQTRKCGLTGRDRAPIGELRGAKECLENAIEARINDLQDEPPIDTISPPASAPNGQTLIITPVAEPSVSAPGGSGSDELPTFQALHFSAPTDGIGGTINCSALSSRQGGDPVGSTNAPKWVVKIVVNDDASSYRMFENDSWAPFLDNLRISVGSACNSALKSGRLRDASNEPIKEIYDVFEVSSPQGLFRAYSNGRNSPWALQRNLPKARKTVKSDLGIQSWISANQLAINPYFFKGSVVGMVIQFDHMLSKNEALFDLPGAQIFVSGVSPNLFQDKERIVLAGRVTGNKGVISPMGSETLLPSLDYIGAYKCGNVCDDF